MRFNGRVQIDADPHGWLTSELVISGHRVELNAGEEQLGAWPVSQVKAERLDGSRFELYLADERAVFEAEDALAFSYEALPKLAKKPIVEAAQGFRMKLLGGGRKPAPAPRPLVDPMPQAEADALLPPVPPEPVPPNVKRLRELIEVARANRPETWPDGDVPAAPSADEFRFAEPALVETEPGPLWSLPDNSFDAPASPSEEARAISLSIVDPAPAEAPHAVGEDSVLAVEIERLSRHVKAARLTPAQTEAAIGVIRSLRIFLDA